MFSPTQGLPGHLCFLANGAATIAVAAAMAFARNESYSQVVKRASVVFRAELGWSLRTQTGAVTPLILASGFT